MTRLPITIVSPEVPMEDSQVPKSSDRFSVSRLSVTVPSFAVSVPSEKLFTVTVSGSIP